MHEISLVRNIFSTLENEFPDRINILRTIYLRVGLLSNVQPVLMQNAFAAVLADEPRYAHTRLEVEVLPIIIKCTHCKTETVVEQYRFLCGQCQQPSNNLIQGDELMISKVEFENE